MYYLVSRSQARCLQSLETRQYVLMCGAALLRPTRSDFHWLQGDEAGNESEGDRDDSQHRDTAQNTIYSWKLDLPEVGGEIRLLAGCLSTIWNGAASYVE